MKVHFINYLTNFSNISKERRFYYLFMMNKFVFSLILAQAVVFGISSANTLIDLCPNVCKVIGDVMKGKINHLLS